MVTQSETPQEEQPSPLEQMLFEIKKVIVGQEPLLERIVVALLSRGHILVEGVPGLAKTLAIRTVAEVVGGQFNRIQFTPDLVPADLIGTRIYNQRSGEFTTSLGPVFTNLLLADEINRAPAKVQSALLEVMQEHQVTIGRESHRVPEPFLVLATQNPIETEGTYQLPEAQVDRFMLKVLVDYPSNREELVIVQRMTGNLHPPRQILSLEELVQMQKQADNVYVDPEIMEYVVRLVGATRRPGDFGLQAVGRYLTFGGSPRASINLILGARALALTRGRDYVVPADIVELAPDVLRHRLVLSYEALADRVTADMIIDRIVDAVPRPNRPFEGDPRGVARPDPAPVGAPA
jgi:MoxR-like ATPase